MQDFLVVNQESEISNINSEIQPASVVPPPKDAPKKNRRGRPRKNNASAARPVAGSSGSANATAVPVSPRANLPEFDLVLDALSLKVRPSTSAAYRKPLEDWQNFCRENRHKYPVDPQFPLTVGPTEFVLAFFKESVMTRTYKKNTSMENDVRTQIALSY